LALATDADHVLNPLEPRLTERLVSLLLLLASSALSAGLWPDRDPVVAAAGGVFYVWVAWISGALSSRRQLALQLVTGAAGFSSIAIETGVTSPGAVIVIVVGASTALGIAHRRKHGCPSRR
jgi:hypothetical protein